MYTLIREGRLEEVIRILNKQLQMSPRSRAALSLLGYCYYNLQDFRMAATMYEQLIRYYPDVEEYRIYHSQSLYKGALYDEAMQAFDRAIELDPDFGPYQVHPLELTIAGGNRAEASRRLGISRARLLRKIDEQSKRNSKNENGSHHD